MSTTTVADTTPTRTRRRGRPLPALAGIGALAAFAGAVVTFTDPLRGAATPAEAAERLAGSSAPLTGMLLAVYAVLAIAVIGRLTARLGRAGDDGAVRALPVLGAVHLTLLTVAYTAPGAAVMVGTQVFDTGVSATAAETALLIANIGHPLATIFGAAFLVAVLVAGRAAGMSRTLLVVSAVFATGLVLPPIGWAVTYLMAFWFAGVGIWLSLRD
jgi:hypothetical protein